MSVLDLKVTQNCNDTNMYLIVELMMAVDFSFALTRSVTTKRLSSSKESVSFCSLLRPPVWVHACCRWGGDADGSVIEPAAFSAGLAGYGTTGCK